MTREEAIKVLERISEDTIQRDCSTCGRPTAGIYSGVCCYCSLCEVVPEILKDYHERKHFRSYWTWDGKRKNEALEMAISALRQQDHFREVTKKVEPLTLDELRKMDGDPVYSVEITGREEWLFRRDGGFADMYGEFTSDDFMSWDNYGKLWWCYSQKPEDGTV